MPLSLNCSDLDADARALCQRALACERLAEQAASEAHDSPEKLEEAGQHYQEASEFIQQILELMTDEEVPGVLLWLYDVEALRLHCLGDHAYFVNRDFQGYIEYHEKSANARRKALPLIPDDESSAGMRLFHKGRMFYVMADAQDGRAILLEREGKWRAAAKAREEERDLKENEIDCLRQILPHERVLHHVSRYWVAERGRLQCLARQAEIDKDFRQALEHLQNALQAAERARCATPDWAPYTQICRELQQQIGELLDDHPDLIEEESVDALMIKSLGRRLESEDGLRQVITSLDEVAARGRDHLIPRCFKTGTPFCPYRLEEREDQVFVGMPFVPEYENVFRFGLEPALRDVGLVTWKANEVLSNIDVMCKICQAIQQSFYAIVNISDWNPNVLFELGLLYAMHKHVLLIKDGHRDVPVDLSGIEYLEYSRFDRLRRRVHRYFIKALERGSTAPHRCFKLGVPQCAWDLEQDPLRVFVAMPFRAEQENMYQYALKPAIEQVGLRDWKADEDIRNVDIMCKTCRSVQRSSYGMADITGWNPNVMFELGLLYGYGKRTLLLNKRGREVPVDLQGLEYIEYEDYVALRKRISKYLLSVSR
jgi:tetratricopeptide (TPR) repeat protein